VNSASGSTPGDTRQHIIDAAVTLIANHGFSATSVDEIAEAAGVAKGSVYYNFGSKSDLFADILSEGITRLTDGLRSARETSPEQPVLETLVGELLRQIHANPAFAKVVAAEVFRTGRDWQEPIRQIHDQAMQVFADGVRAIRPELDARDAAIAGSALFGATLVAGLEWLAFQPDRERVDVLRALMATVAVAPAAEHG
jgi:AcrR family transcriptional regulator